MKQRNHGIYDIITSEKEILKITTSTKFCVVHFFHKEFRRCQIMDKHLMTIARKHFKTRFVKIDVENASFLVEKLKIQILPCVVCFVDGVSTDRLIGFQDLGNNDNFTTEMVEKRLAKANVIKTSEQTLIKPKKKTIFGFADRGDGEEDYDSDE
jgi:thioredoxin-like negative regulator of GroEL